jgi:hypothetical protein
LPAACEAAARRELTITAIQLRLRIILYPPPTVDWFIVRNLRLRNA